MKVKKIINEVFFDYIKNGFDTKVEVYLNPSKREFKKMDLEHGVIRFIAVKKGKKVYVFDAKKAVHINLEKKLKLLYMMTLSGMAIKKKDEWIMDSCHEIENLFNEIPHKKKRNYSSFEINRYKYLRDLLGTDWSFVNRYIYVDEYLIKKREEFRKIYKIV